MAGNREEAWDIPIIPTRELMRLESDWTSELWITGIIEMCLTFYRDILGLGFVKRTKHTSRHPEQL